MIKASKKDPMVNANTLNELLIFSCRSLLVNKNAKRIDNKLCVVKKAY